MKPGAPTRGRRRGFRRRILIGAALALLGIPALANVWLSLPAGRDWIARRIQQKTGLDVRVGPTTLTPWNGVTVHGLEFLQPPPLRSSVHEPLVRIGTARLAPVWKSWLQGRPELQSVELDSPRVVLPLELVADIARSQKPAAPPTPQAAAVPPPAAPANPPPVVATPPPPAPAAKPEPPPQAPAIPPRPTGWVRLKNASLTVPSAASGKPWLEVSGFNASIPVSGNAAESPLDIRSVRIAGQEALADLHAALAWQAPLLTLKPVETETHGVKFTLTGKLGLTSGLPMQVEAQAPKQKPAPLTLPGEGRAEAEAVAGNARFRGFLLAPGAWQGELVTEALSPSIHFAGHDAKFDRGFAINVLRGGLLSCADARLIGDELSLLGNATLLADGRLAGTLRLVAPPDSVTAIVNRVFPKLPQPPSLTPLSTPQRAAFDLEAFGNIRQIFLRPGKDGPIMELQH